MYNKVVIDLIQNIKDCAGHTEDTNKAILALESYLKGVQLGWSMRKIGEDNG